MLASKARRGMLLGKGTNMTNATDLLPAEEYGRLPNDGPPTELVRGIVVELPNPYPRHGQICARIAYLLRKLNDEELAGHVVMSNCGVVTERDPDTVRGPDVAFYSYARVPPGPLPNDQYLTVMPELVFEVRSPSDRWRKVLSKVNEYLEAGVGIVCVVDDETKSVRIFDDEDVRSLSAEDELAFPSVLPNFRVKVRKLFE
jgi:Uma2 family endonuclease